MGIPRIFLYFFYNLLSTLQCGQQRSEKPTLKDFPELLMMMIRRSISFSMFA